MQALFDLGYSSEAAAFVGWLLYITRMTRPELQILYDVFGEPELDEKELTHLSGFMNSRPVRIGNAAHDQLQLDVYGEVVDAVCEFERRGGVLDRASRGMLRAWGDTVCRRWHEPDEGIWESRSGRRHHTYSKVMCWVAADRGARLARLRMDDQLGTRWQAAADEIHADICANGLDGRSVFTQHYETDALDASLLLMPLVRFLPPDDERIRNTVLAIADELTVDGLVLRYRVEQTDDGLPGEEGAFTICSFWLVSALSEIGEAERARRLCERLLAFAGSLQLFSEEIDARSGRQLGNFPQAFTHLALINAVSHVIADELAPREAEQPTAVFSEIRALS